MRSGYQAVLCAAVMSLLLFGSSSRADDRATLDDAIKACTDSAALIEEASAIPTPLGSPMQKLLARAKAEATTGKVLLIKDNYTEAVKAFGRSAALCREALKNKDRPEVLLYVAGGKTVMAAGKKIAVPGPITVTGTMTYAPPPNQQPTRMPPRPSAFEFGKRLLFEAQKALAAGDTELLRRLCIEAAERFADAGREKIAVEAVPARPKISPFDNISDPEQLVRLLESNMALGEKLGCEDLLARIEKLIPRDPRLVWMRRAVESMPGPKNQLSLDLGDGTELELVLIRPGTFIMGSEAKDIFAMPPHQVTLTKPYYIGKYKVTQKQWETMMGDNPSHFRGPRNPVENVNFDDCQRFVRKLNEKFAATGMKFSLPTSAQWEYACRAGSTTRFCFGDNESELHQYAWFGLNSNGRTHPVGEKKPNAWGLYDMHGNLWETCSDWYDNPAYPSRETLSPEFGPLGPPSGWAHVLRGGSWSASIPRCESASRYPGNPSVRIFNCGLRVVCTAEQ